MTFTELNRACSPYRVALSLDEFFPRNARLPLRYFFLILAFVSFISSFIDINAYSYSSLPDGLFFLFLSFFSIMFLLESFYNASKYANASIDFYTALILAGTDEFDLAKGFINSYPARFLMDRLGITKEEREQFINSERVRVLGNTFSIEKGENRNTFAEYAKTMFEADKSWASFVASRGVSREDYDGAAEWVGQKLSLSLEGDRWWSRESMEKVPSIGTSFSYGMVHEVSKYAVDISYTLNTKEFDVEGTYREKELIQLENALVRSTEANAIFVDNDESVVRDIVARFSKKIKFGLTSGVLEHKNVLILDWNELVADHKSKAELEDEVYKILSECSSAGNIILYIPNLPSFIAEAKMAGVSLPNLMEEYLVSPKIHIIAHAVKTDFYYFIETNPGLERVFERIVPLEKGAESAMPVVLEKALETEHLYKNKIFFTYPGLCEICEFADRYIALGEMPTKAINILVELTAWAIQNGIKVVTRNDVAVFVSAKTGIAAGEVSETESIKLGKLEELLHERIVGQDEAVKAVSNAMRRSRAGISNPNRPIASFLFLGPTGVGKTETAKALAQSFFGDEEEMSRFDMSEYNGADATPRLIGSFSESKIGTLTSKLRDTPYGVLLLDEFEKAAPDVLNLFLRIIDEGKYTDAFGGEVGARNSIIIATSNAGSDMIWEAERAGFDLEKKRDLIIDYIVDTHIFKPELLNRFDAIVIFKPLNNSELRNVSQKMMAKFAERIRSEKQIELKSSDELLDYLVLHGSDKEFGARSINRIMQQKIEDVVARKILSKEAKAGSVLEIGVKDIL